MGASARQAKHHARSAGKQHAQALIGTDRAINWIGVGKTVRRCHGQIAENRARQLGQTRGQRRDQRIGLARVDGLVIVAGIIVAAKSGPVIPRQRIGADLAHGEDIEPQQHRPHPVLLADMVRSGAGAFLAADRRQAGIEQRAEKLPARRRFKTRDVQRGGHAVSRCAGRHRTRNTLQAGCIARREMGIGRQHRQAVRRRDEAAAPDDQIAIAIAVRRCAEIRCARCHHQIIQRLGMHKIGIGVMPAKIFERHAAAHRAGGKAQPPLQNLGGIRPGDSVHRIKGHGEAAGHCGPNARKIEQAFHQISIIGNRINHFDGHVRHHHRADHVQIDIGRCDCQPAVNRLGAGIDGIGDGFGCGAAVGDVVLDAEILVRPAGIVAGRQDQPAAGAIFADDVAGCWR